MLNNCLQSKLGHFKRIISAGQSLFSGKKVTVFSEKTHVPQSELQFFYSDDLKYHQNLISSYVPIIYTQTFGKDSTIRSIKYYADKKVWRQRWRNRDPHKNQYAQLQVGVGDIISSVCCLLSYPR